MRRLLKKLFPILIMGASLYAQSDTTLNQHIEWFIHDPSELLFNTRGAFILSHGMVMAGSGLLMIPKDNVRYYTRENYIDGPYSPFSYFNHLGSAGTAFLMTSVYGTTLLTKNRKLKDAAFTSVQSAAYASVITGFYKLVLGRVRPEDGDPAIREGHLDFRPFSLNDSFPSGHATTAFALLTPWFMYYPSWYTALLFTGAAGTAIARMGLDKHWGTDVLAGAGIGFFTGYYLSRLHLNREGNFRFGPVIVENSPGLGCIASY